MENKIVFRKINKTDIKNAKAFQNYLNALVEENAMIEKEYLEDIVKKSKTRVVMVIMCDDRPIGIANVTQEKHASNHICVLGVSIAKEYRGQSLGTKLITQIIETAKKEIEPKPKIIQLRVYAMNKPAIGLYRKLGFEQVAKLPKQIYYKGELVDEFVMNKYLD